MDTSQSSKMKCVFQPMLMGIQKMALYETKARFYLVGSNNMQTKFRVLKIDRTEPRDLVVIDDKVEYSQKEIRDLIVMIDTGNRSKPNQKPGTGLMRTVSAFGIVGFIQFLQGYYVILITKRRRVAMIGHHSIYKIEDTTMIYIPNDTTQQHPDEVRYVKMFQNIDMSSNFYFSYSYDLTHTLQYNILSLKRTLKVAPEMRESSEIFDVSASSTSSVSIQKGKVSVEAAQDFFSSLKRMNPDTNLQSTPTKTSPKGEHSGDASPQQDISFVYGIRNKPMSKFVWNEFLFKPVVDTLHSDWTLHITHGFVGQCNISVFGKPLYLTLIARRSNKYAGTRFLKRGANFEGDVANEVETEQVLFDSSVSDLHSGRYTSFVQLRGSIPTHWCQDVSKMVPKPPISFILGDPYVETAGAHFNQLLKRYGSPIIILNLVKKREKKRHESMLTGEFLTSVIYLNQFLPPEHHIQYISFDMARINKLKEANVMARLGEIAEREVRKTGIFQNFQPYYHHLLRSQPHHRKLEEKHMKLMESMGQNKEEHVGRRQTGLIRVNCVDCLDRTNTAQFALGKCALGYQLYALGIIPTPNLEFDSDCVRMLEGLYEDHGDTLALQYGGSQLVHRIKTYRKTSPWTSQSNDIMQTLSRYYSNTFSDSDKQNAMNLFLGLFVPLQHPFSIWDLTSDYYMHHSRSMAKREKKKTTCTQWWHQEVFESLPVAYDEEMKPAEEIVCIAPTDETVDSYLDYYRPFEFTTLSDLSTYTMSHSVKDFMPNSTVDFSPFSVRGLPGKRREETTKKGVAVKNPSVSGQSSITSTTSTSSSTEEDDTSSHDEHDFTEDRFSESGETMGSSLTFDSLFPSMKSIYGTEIRSPKKQDHILYRKYAAIAKMAVSPPEDSYMTPYLQTFTTSQRKPRRNLLRPLTDITSDFTSLRVTPPTVSPVSFKVYYTYIERGIKGATMPPIEDLTLYREYADVI